MVEVGVREEGDIPPFIIIYNFHPSLILSKIIHLSYYFFDNVICFAI